MANPVISRLDTEWSKTTPAGYPTMPGYTPGQSGNAQPSAGSPYPYGTPAPQQGPATSQYDERMMADAERAYHGPSADAVDLGRMTYDDVIVKTGLLFALLAVAGLGSAWLTTNNFAAGAGLLTIASIAGFVLAMVNIFSRTIRPALIVAYAIVEGLVLGGFSAVFEMRYPGIVVQAVVASIAVFGVTLGLFASGKVRNSSKMMRFTLIALVGIVVFRLIDWLLSFIGLGGAGTLSNLTIMGLPLGMMVGVLAVVIGALCLIQDFDGVKVGVQNGVPKQYSWQCAFGLTVTLVWMYIEILRLLSYFRD